MQSQGDSPSDPGNGTAPMAVLLVDDDRELCRMLGEYLVPEGFVITTVHDGDEALYTLGRHHFDLIVLDVMLPRIGGLDVLRQLRQKQATPVLMLTARGEEVDRVVGLELGADDYLPKPFNPRELLARIRAVLRRGSEARSGQEVAEQSRFGPFALNLAAQSLSRDGDEIAITQAEFTLLKLFVEHPNRALSRDQIMDWLKGYERDPFDRSIDVRVTRLRRKIEDDPANPAYIRTIWGQGYLFAPKGKGA